MARDGNGVYSKPAGTTAVSGTTIESAKFNTLIDDIVSDLNLDRPVAAGGTGASTAADARTNLGLGDAATGTIGSDVQGHGDVLDDLNTLGANAADGEFLVGTGAGALDWESGATARASLGVPASSSFSHRNRIINGNFAVNQEGVSGTVSLSAGEYGHDMWKAGASGCTYTFATSENVTTITITAGSLKQVISGDDLQSGTHVLSWGGTLQFKIDGGSAGDSGMTGTVTGGTDVEVETSGTGTMNLVQFEPGSVVTPFEFKSDSAQLWDCLKYYWRINGSASDEKMVVTGSAFNSSTAWLFFTYPRKMAGVPSVTCSGLEVFGTGSLGAVSSLTANDASDEGMRAIATISGGTTNAAIHARLTASASSFVAFDARP